MPNKLSELLELARNAQGDKHIYNQNDEVRAVIPGKPVVRGIIDLSQADMLPSIEDKNGNLKRAPNGQPSVENIKLDAAIIKQSLVARAGANVIVYKDATEAISDTAGGIVMMRKAAYYETFESAPFALVADGDEVGVTPLPIKRAAIHVDAAAGGPQTGTGIYGLRFEFDRATLKGYPSVEQAIMYGITMGLARTADQALLQAIVAATPAAFSLAAAASASVRMSELQAIIGTAAHGASIDQNGTLRAAGIAGELSAETAATIVGTFARSAIMIRSDVDVIAERTKIDGSLAITAWAALQPLVPDSSRFWTVAA